MKTIRIFLSSPGDCKDERTSVHELAKELNQNPVFGNFIQLEVIAWDWNYGIPLEAHYSPQTSVNAFLPVPESCEIFVGIFRYRFGSPLPKTEYRKPDGSPFLSGSEYEFHRAWNARRRGTFYPYLLVYRLNDADTAEYPDAQQYQHLQHFFSNSPFKENESWTGSYNRFANTAEFKEQLRQHLQHIIRQWRPGSRLPLDEWMKRQALRLTSDAGPRYTADAHVKTEIDTVFDWLLSRQDAIHEFDRALAGVWKKIPDEKTFSKFRSKMTAIATNLRGDPYWEKSLDLDFIANTLEELEIFTWAYLKEIDDASNGKKKTHTENYEYYRLEQLAFDSRKTYTLIKEFAPFYQKRILLLTGPAGQGKTHTLLHEIHRILEDGGIAVGILGHTLSNTGDLWPAILQRLDYQGTLTEFLDDLENTAASKGKRALLVFDALNETPNRSRWKSQLSGMISEILVRPHLVLAMSVRSDYLSIVLPAHNGTPNWAELQHSGFSNIGVDALLAYCAYYDVKAPVAPPIGELGNPLYVQLLVKSLQGKKDTTHWLPSWLDVWEAWIARLEDDAVEKLERNDPSRPTPIRRTLNRLTQTMLDTGRFALSRNQADQIAKKISGLDGVIGYLCSAGALIDRIDDADEEIIEFGFERLSDTFLIDRLIRHLFEKLSSPNEKRLALLKALSTDGVLYPLAANEYIDHPLAYHRQGLLAALCLAAPQQIGTEMPILIPIEPLNPLSDKRVDWELRDAFIDSIRWRNRPEEFGLPTNELWELWQKTHTLHQEAELDELIRLALIPAHPFAMENLLHPWLLEMPSMAERDAAWSIHLTPLWFDESSTLKIFVIWASKAILDGVNADVALPAARLLTWTTATSQRGLRLHAMRGLTRLLAACPQILEKFLPDFLSVDDAYVLESVLLAVKGIVGGGNAPNEAYHAARLVYESQFQEGNARWCHLTIRHYARQIVKIAHEQYGFTKADLNLLSPPYQSSLSLEELPDKNSLMEKNQSNGFRSIIRSCFMGDFYWYVMGATSGGKNFSSTPLVNSNEPSRFYNEGDDIGRVKRLDIFDIPLAARYVVWNCLQLGWTAERFDEFDKGPYVSNHGRISEEGRTERIGKKYQWISWQTMLGFLADNYEMTPKYGNETKPYDNPHQIYYIETHDPSRWLYTITRQAIPHRSDQFSKICSLSPWPLPDEKDIKRWIESPSHDLRPSDIVHTIPTLPEEWGEGPWLRVAVDSIWKSEFAPGQWEKGYEYLADIWWQIWPVLIRSDDMGRLLKQLDRKPVQEKLAGLGRLDPDQDWNASIIDWPNLKGDFDRSFGKDRYADGWLPIPWMPLVGSCGHPDKRDEHRPTLLPWPRLFREWGLTMDLHRGIILHENDIVFGLTSWIFDEENTLFARTDKLNSLLNTSGYSLIWHLRGERRAFLDIGNPHKSNRAWADYHGISSLGRDGMMNVLWLEKKVL
ncbi:ATP-binding protein [Oxalobacter vibrioformis]|uniref:ATP-binding protein n=1 Tax=Oxalobacter vibrioformis TaxID=933080 RepID=A0A9E9LVB1_9BURK|nr:ATP-binding protein [Oxalobacter vibrioformis]WAW10370.1 ATP-binding protein [Oxalobacter vibrioformis]